MAKAYDYPVLHKSKPYINSSTARHLKETDLMEEPMDKIEKIR